MTHYDPILKAYADNGLRSAAEWLTLGRAVHDDAEPRALTTHLREPLPLYTRGQTRIRPSARRSRARDAAADAAAAAAVPPAAPPTPTTTVTTEPTRG
jgi:hypothetical protein